MKLRGPLLSVVALAVVAALCSAAMVVTYGSLRFDGQVGYNAMFRDVSGLRAGDDVRIAGVTVGRVQDVALADDNTVRVAFTAQGRQPLPVGSLAKVRYKNLIGQRYLELAEGVGPQQTLPAGGVIPLAQTTPALDLDELYNGFSPLFEGLTPDQVNQLSAALIAVFQGQGAQVQDLLGSIGSLTSALADKDQVIGELITNLNSFLDTVNARGPQLSTLVDQLQQLISGLAKDRSGLGNSLQRIDSLTTSVSGLLADARPAIQGDIAGARRTAELVNSDRDALNTLLQRVPGYYQILGRVGIYQQGFQFYLCGVQLRIGDVLSDVIASQEKRCQF